jgi:polyketide biosynthesis enoyl-CoA hydratase PksI
MGQVVHLQELGNDIVQITMEDRSSKNTFSHELMEGIVEAFTAIKTNTTYKVVILTGYENYFCCGGTKVQLISIFKGDRKFSDFDFFTHPLDCAIPVISAMQGHGFGGGLVFGSYADFIILGRENIYAANFMKYGFTPGMGGTLMIPLKFGNVIGNEMLFSAENYRGADFEKRGTSLKVVSKSEVLNEAITLAKSLAENSRLSLITLKEHLNAEITAKLPLFIEKELKMHDITIHQTEVPDRIENLFGR